MGKQSESRWLLIFLSGVLFWAACQPLNTKAPPKIKPIQPSLIYSPTPEPSQTESPIPSPIPSVITRRLPSPNHSPLPSSMASQNPIPIEVVPLPTQATQTTLLPTPSPLAPPSFLISKSPVISAILPTGGKKGDTITVSGSNFTEITKVKLNSEPALFNILSDTTLTLTVPAKALTGSISITNSWGTSASPPFAITKEIKGDLEEYLLSIPINNTVNAQFIPAQTPAKAAWQQMIAKILEEKIGEATAQAHLAGYTAIEFTHIDGKRYFILEQQNPDNNTHQGFFVFAIQPQREIALQIPHPVLDVNTRSQSIAVFFAVQPRVLMVANATACNVCATSSTFEGFTQACNSLCGLTGNNAYRISDVTHHVDNLFHEMHKTLVDLQPNLVFLQLHGASDNELGLDGGNQQIEAILSHGVNEVSQPGSLIRQLEQQLNINGVNAHIFPDTTGNLGASTNLQGRYSNGGSITQCLPPTCSASDKFIHLEQNSTLRTSPQPLINTLLTVFP